jgi:hypothetical protein
VWPGNRAPKKPIETFPASEAMQDISSGWERTATSPKRASGLCRANTSFVRVTRHSDNELDFAAPRRIALGETAFVEFEATDNTR